MGFRAYRFEFEGVFILNRRKGKWIFFRREEGRSHCTGANLGRFSCVCFVSDGENPNAGNRWEVKGWGILDCLFGFFDKDLRLRSLYSVAALSRAKGEGGFKVSTGGVLFFLVI